MQLNSQYASASSAQLISVSLVVYRPHRQLLERTLITLDNALHRLFPADVSVSAPLYLINNGTDEGFNLSEVACETALQTHVIEGHGNVGYGRGHNLAIELTSTRYHLILNPDIELDGDALTHALAFMDVHPEVGLLSPQIVEDDGSRQYLCRRYPTVFDLFVRGFLPRSLKKPFEPRLARYEMRDVINDKEIVWDPPIVSGCFMLFRTEVLKKLNGFDPRYFLYFEDYDLSLRAHEVARVAYVPSVRVMHHGGDAAGKGWTHIKLFIASAYKFFNRFGWKWL
ncbi:MULTISPECIES: glycosyltransferase family 2 protein [unclassified Caballeronia]|uniref:glycosyltransferase family 2 protein n=1 Tax=unclassified Caballeronia TaxID=2646786 RepID=UPI0028583749|nr:MULTISPECIES: glycosyltransferase family 2 protein [unclassified Caballeronia]MDR5737696.1 glycosyltransferase family 2 protein [Caballeronia sp. LZ016]MDR5809767.1 glycosyltransferase family 2 protein [Caballeronia sp. LZ019]